MKIDRVVAYGIELPQRMRYEMAVANYARVRSVLVEIGTSDGHLGIGQASVYASAHSPYGETLEGAVHAINTVLGPQLIGADPLAIEAAHMTMHRWLQGNPAAKAAIDIALHDVSGCILGVPVYSLLGGPLMTRLPMLATIGHFGTDELVERAHRAAEQGYRALKIRVGESLETDMRNLTALRNRLGEEFPISIDFNQAMSEIHRRPDLAIGYIRRLEAFNIDTIEQPVAGYDFANMAAIAAAIDTPIVADESIWTLQDARRAIEMRACDIIKIRLVKTGGLLPARKIAALCEASGMPIAIGQGTAGVVQNAAEAHLAASLPNWKQPGEMNGYLKLAKDIAAPIPVEHGTLILGSAPGLGIKLSPQEIKELAVA